MTAFRGAAVRDIWRRYWPVDLLAVVILAVVLIFGSVLTGIINRADSRATRTQQALCSLIDRYPTGRDVDIDKARLIGDCGHVKPPTVFLGKPTPSRTVIIRPTPAPARTVLVITPTRTVSPSPSRTATRSPTPRPTPSHSPSPRPTPSHTPTPCLIPGVPPGCGH